MNFGYFLDIDCGGEGILKVIKFIWKLLDIVKFVVPMGLIVMVMVDFGKNVIAGREDDMKKNVNIILKRIIFAMAIFLVPTIVKTAIHLLGEIDVDYAACIEIAINEDDLSKYKNKYESGDFGNNNIVIPDNLKKNKSNKKKVNSDSGDSSSNDVDNSIKENIAALIASEQGCNSEKVYIKYISTAVFVNNYYYHTKSTEFTKEGMTKTTTSYSYTPDGLYNGLTFAKVESYRGSIPEEDKKRCLKIVDNILDKKFTIPKNINYCAAPYIITNSSGTIWGQESLTGGTWPVAFGYNGAIESTDVYGNKVSTSWDETVKKAKKLAGETSTGSGRNNNTDK